MTGYCYIIFHIADIQVIAASEIQEIQGNCLQLFTCTTGPIQGNLFWYAQFVNGSEIRFARNDGGNAEPNPPYNEITLDGATDYYTSVTREVMNGDLFTNFNSTLAFDGIFSIRSKIAFVICGSVNSNSSKIPIQLPQIKGKLIMFYFILKKKHYYCMFVFLLLISKNYHLYDQVTLAFIL